MSEAERLIYAFLIKSQNRDCVFTVFLNYGKRHAHLPGDCNHFLHLQGVLIYQYAFIFDPSFIQIVLLHFTKRASFGCIHCYISHQKYYTIYLL